MNTNKLTLNAVRVFGVALLVLSVLFSYNSQAAEVIWDRQVRVAGLIAFPSVRNENEYYYAATRARIARENGLPKFSFVRFSETNSSGGENALGGGVVHALVELGVSENELEEARDALSEAVPGARLVGPVAYKSGTFALITSQAGGDEEESENTILGMGNAPLLEGNRAAISMMLTARNANILWATFNTPTPDISFSFNMEIDAYRSPIEATVSADWGKVYEHENFSAAFRAGLDSEQAQIMLGGEIESTYDELTNSGAIEIEYIGEDEGLQRATEATYEDLREIMFSPANMAGTNSFTPEYQNSAYDRASAAFEQAEQNRKQRNQRSREDRDAARTAAANAAGEQAGSAANTTNIEELEAESGQANQVADQAQEAYEALSRELASADQSNENVQRALTAARERADAKRAIAERVQQQLTTARNAQVERAEEAARASSLAESTENERDWEQGTQLTVSAYVAYRMKTVKQTGTFSQNMRKYKAQSFTLRFDENIGNFTRYLANRNVFVETALDQMVFSQREIFVEYGEIDDSYFENALNSVVVSIRKEHENGQISRRNIRLAKGTINEPKLSMIYVSNGDRNADNFNRYQYKVDWNYKRGVSFNGDWVDHEGPSISLSPPLTMESVQLNLDPEMVDQLGVLGATIRTSSPVGEQSIKGEVVSLRPSLTGDDGFSVQVPVLMNSGTPVVNYKVDLTLDTGQSISLDERQSSSTLVIINDRWRS